VSAAVDLIWGWRTRNQNRIAAITRPITAMSARTNHHGRTRRLQEAAVEHDGLGARHIRAHCDLERPGLGRSAPEACRGLDDELGEPGDTRLHGQVRRLEREPDEPVFVEALERSLEPRVAAVVERNVRAALAAPVRGPRKSAPPPAPGRR
jgi:hypothetical protein